MKEPSTPQATYDGSLKELAARLVGLISAVLFLLIIPVPLFLAMLWADINHHIPGSPYREITQMFFIVVNVFCYGLIAYQSVRMIRLLFPYLWLALSGVACIPLLNIPLAVILWVCALRHLRARGVQATLFGINPDRLS